MKNLKGNKTKGVHKKTGLPPGTLVHVGDKKAKTVRITYIDYDEQNIEEKQISTIEECFQFKSTATVTWINIDGLHEVEVIEKLGKQFELHPLILEDILHTTQRPKFEDFENFTNQVRFPSLVMQWQDGKLVTIWPRRLAPARYRYPVPKWSVR